MANGRATGTTHGIIGMASGKVQTVLGIGVVGTKPDRVSFVMCAT